jgi:L-ascorbate metabolism protein UlaG (beta-lactamase superfamily)
MSPVHVDPAQAVQIHKDLKSELSIGMHFGTFPLADDGQNEPINDFNKVVGDERFILLEEGEKHTSTHSF